MNPYVVYRNKNIFGEDAHLFRPERWIERNEKTMDRDMLQVSGYRELRRCRLTKFATVLFRLQNLFWSAYKHYGDEQNSR